MLIMILKKKRCNCEGMKQLQNDKFSELVQRRCSHAGIGFKYIITVYKQAAESQ